MSKVISELLWFYITSLSDWLKVLAPLFQPIRRETKTNRGSRVHIFPRLRVITLSFDWFTGLSPSFLIGQSNYFGFGFRHSFENRSKLLVNYFVIFNLTAISNLLQKKQNKKKNRLSLRPEVKGTTHAQSTFSFKQFKVKRHFEVWISMLAKLSRLVRLSTSEIACKRVLPLKMVRGRNKWAWLLVSNPYISTARHFNGRACLQATSKK